jgi:hypothetical protein
MATMYSYELCGPPSDFANLSRAMSNLLITTSRLIGDIPSPHFNVRRPTSLVVVEYGASLPPADAQLPLSETTAPLFDARLERDAYSVVAALPRETTVGTVLCGAKYRTNVGHHKKISLCPVIGYSQELILHSNDVVSWLPEGRDAESPAELTSAAAVVESLAIALDTLRCNHMIGGEEAIWASIW